jgi:hypothetical protein
LRENGCRVCLPFLLGDVVGSPGLEMQVQSSDAGYVALINPFLDLFIGQGLIVGPVEVPTSLFKEAA